MNLETIKQRVTQLQMLSQTDRFSPPHVKSLTKFSGPAKSVALMLFETIDADHSLAVTFREFETTVAVSECVGIINADPVIAFETIACRMELLLQETEAKKARTPPDRRAELNRLDGYILTHCRKLAEADSKLRECRAKIHGSMRLNRHFSMATLDRVCVMVLLAHMCILSLYGTAGNGWILDEAAPLAFCLFYLLEMLARIKAAKTLSR